MQFNEYLCQIRPDEPPLVRTLPGADDSEMGRWLEDAATRAPGQHPLFAALRQAHQHFHDLAEEAIRLAGEDRMDLASTLLNTDFERARAQVLRLKRKMGNVSNASSETELRGALGLVTEVEIAASALEPRSDAAYAFSIRDVGRRLAPSERALPTKVPASVQQLTELVGRVPLKQIVAETSDLIERLSIETALTMTKDNRAMAAQLLGLSRQSLYVKLRRFGMGGLEAGDEG